MTTCLLEGGCPCTNAVCPNHGICAQCIRRHCYEVDHPVYCMRPGNREAIFEVHKGEKKHE